MLGREGGVVGQFGFEGEGGGEGVPEVAECAGE